MLGAGLTTEDVQDSKRRLDASAQVRVLELAAKELQDDCFGFHLARGFELGRDRATVLRYGLVGAARRRASKRGALLRDQQRGCAAARWTGLTPTAFRLRDASPNSQFVGTR